MPRNFIALLLLSVATAGTAQTPPSPGPQMVRRMRPPSPPPTFVGERTEVAMDASKGMPLVTVMIAGKPYRFGVDTGAAGHGRISPTLAEALGLTVSGEVMAGDGSGQAQMRRTFALPELTLGEVRFTGLNVLELARLPEGVSGILGLGLFQGHLLSLDYGGGKLKLSREALPESAATYVDDPRRGGINLPAMIGGESITVRLDTGNSVGALIVPTVLAERLPKTGAVRAAGQARTGVSSMEIKEADVALILSVAGTELPLTKITFPSLDDVANLGSRALAGAVLKIDQANRRLAIERAK
jgi:predicted aspartyl protease